MYLLLWPSTKSQEENFLEILSLMHSFPTFDERKLAVHVANYPCCLSTGWVFEVFGLKH